MLRFANPELLLLAIAVALGPLLVRPFRSRPPGLVVPAIGGLSRLAPSPRARLRRLLPVLRALVLLLVVVALARPQAASKPRVVAAEAVDIVLVLDTSSSMRSPDFQPLNRLEVAKQVVSRFVDRREADRI